MIVREAREIDKLSIFRGLAHILLFPIPQTGGKTFENHPFTIKEAVGRNGNQICLALLSEKNPGPDESSQGFLNTARLHNPKRSLHE
jgi:hypothetical protein